VECGALHDGLTRHIQEADARVLRPGDQGAVPGVGQELHREDVANMLRAQLNQLPTRRPAPQYHSLYIKKRNISKYFMGLFEQLGSDPH